MSNQFMTASGKSSLLPLCVASAVPSTFSASAWLLATTMRSYSLMTGAWRSLMLWPFVAPPELENEVEEVDSSKVQFTLSGERFPIDLLGSYDIDRAKGILKRAPRKSLPINVELWRAFAEQVGWERLQMDPTVDTSVPAIMATIDAESGEYMLIDGWHRIGKASSEGREAIQAFYLTEGETKEVFDMSWKGLPSKDAVRSNSK